MSEYTFFDNEATDAFLEHHGVLGMHWGERKYQNQDGSLTEQGRKHYGVGPARELARKIKSTAQKANSTISTAARKTFNPTSADMDEKLAKAREKQLIKEKKKELALLQGRNRKMKDMTDQEVFNEIQSRKNRIMLEEMRKDASKIQKGKEFAKTTAGVLSVPVKAIGSIAADTAEYGIRQLGKTAIDTALNNKAAQSKKKAQLKNRTDSEILKDALQDAKNARDLADINFQESLRDIRNEEARNKAQYDKDASYLRRSVLSGDEQGSKMAAERLDREKKALGGKYSADGDKKKDQQKQGLSKQQKDDMREIFREIAKEQEEQKRLKKQNRKKNQNN